MKYREQEHRAVQVAAGKALVLKDDRLLRCGIAVVGADIFAAEVDLLLRLCPDDEDTIYQIVDSVALNSYEQGHDQLDSEDEYIQEVLV